MEREVVIVTEEIESSRPKDRGETSGRNMPNDEAGEDALKEIRI